MVEGGDGGGARGVKLVGKEGLQTQETRCFLEVFSLQQ